ncbi:hypothetical protein ACOSQ2_031555 [Xanthoceras sorbifolium]
MFSMNVPKYLWGEAILTAAYLINRVPSRVLQHETPFNCLKKVFPHNRISSPLPFKVFGCTVFVHKPSLIRSKLDARSEKCIFLGYAPNKRGYKYFNPTKKKTYVSMDVVFFENTPFFKNHLQGERKREDDDSLDFLDTPTPLPALIDPTDFSVFNPPQTTSKSVVDLEPNKEIVNLESEFVLESNKDTGPNLETLESNLLLHQFGTNSGGEISQDNHPNLEHCPNTELQVYTRTKPPLSNRDFLHQVPAQSKPPRLVSEPQMTQHGKTSIPNPSIIVSSSKPTTKTTAKSSKNPIKDQPQDIYRATALGICEVIWIRRLLEDLKVPVPIPLKLYCDNKSAIAIAHNPVLHDKTKHVEIDKHFIKEKLDSGLVGCQRFNLTNLYMVVHWLILIKWLISFFQMVCIGCKENQSTLP